MKSISKLKDDARRHEQKEEWEKAIQVYLQVLQVSEEGEAEVELPLYNRIGDLAVRLGRAKDAVRYYEQAADRYAEAGLYNNAIALCNKALRYGPDRVELLKKLGSFSASQGFITDARRYFLDYAERRFTGGQIDEALSALEDFASVSDDAEVREMLGRRLTAYGRTAQAVTELQRAYTLRKSAGEHDQADTLRREIAALDPNASPDAAPGSVSPASNTYEPEPLAELPGLTFEVKPAASAAPPATSSIEGGKDTTVSDDDAGFHTIELAGFEGGAARSDAAAGGASVGGMEGLETTSFDFGSVSPDVADDLDVESTAFELPMLDEPAETTASLDLSALDDETETTFELPALDDETETTFELPALDDETETTSFELPLLDDAVEEAGEDDAFELPLLDMDDVTFGQPALDTEDATSYELPSLEIDEAEEDAMPFELPTQDEPDALSVPPAAIDERMPFELPPFDDVAEEDAFTLPSFDVPDEVSGTAPAEADQDAAESAFVEDAMASISDFDRSVTEADPWAEESPAVVEDGSVSFSIEDLTAEMEQAEAAREEAESVVEPAAEWTPEMSLPAAPEPAAPKQAPPAAPPQPVPQPVEGGFIDLAALLTENAEETTRFKVQENAPTGDEDRDFAELLNQFKAKVSEHLPAEDASAHYDLGLAFKEMGLIDEAIAEFQIALRAGHMRLKVYEELGQCFLHKQQFNIAEKVLRRALEMEYDDELELLGVYYHLARAYEELDRREQAREMYERVLGMDINFQDVTARLARL